MTTVGIGLAAWFMASIGVGILVAIATPGINRLKEMNEKSWRHYGGSRPDKTVRPSRR